RDAGLQDQPCLAPSPAERHLWGTSSAALPECGTVVATGRLAAGPALRRAAGIDAPAYSLGRITFHFHQPTYRDAFSLPHYLYNGFKQCPSMSLPYGWGRL